MIAFVEGKLTLIEQESVVLEVGGFGIRVFTPITEELVRVGIGGTLKLYTYLNVREDAMQLYGFLNPESLELYKKLINVNSVGPKSAMGIMSGIPLEELILCIASGDEKRLSKTPGIGTKTASRIILDLKDKIGSFSASAAADPAFTGAASVPAGPVQEAILALESLGFSQSEAAGAVRQCFQPDMSVEEIIRQCLKML